MTEQVEQPPVETTPGPVVPRTGKTRFAVISIDKLLLESKHDDRASAVDAAVELMFPPEVKDIFKKSKKIPKGLKSYFVAEVWDN